MKLSRRRFLRAFSLAAASLGLRPALTAAEEKPSDLTDWINPLIGASTSSKLGEGKTYSGPSTPFSTV